ncbi:hypothetical protein ACWDA7_38800 [Streptomyces sp. NPDC001156]
MSRRTVRQAAGAFARYTVICSIAALVADLLAVPFNGQAWSAVWLAAMVVTSYLLSVAADALTGQKGGQR